MWNLKFMFCENSNAGKAKLKKFCLLALILLIEKDATFWLWHHVVANLISKICTKLYQNRPCFVKDTTKTFWCFSTVLTAVLLQNTNAKFRKVGYRYYSGKVENVYTSVRQIYSDNMYQILSKSVMFCRLYIKKHFGVFFLVHSVFLLLGSKWRTAQGHRQWLMLNLW